MVKRVINLFQAVSYNQEICGEPSYGHITQGHGIQKLNLYIHLLNILNNCQKRKGFKRMHQILKEILFTDLNPPKMVSYLGSVT